MNEHDESRWLVAGAARETWRRASDAYRELAPGSVPRLLFGILVAWALCASLVAALVAVGRRLVDAGIRDFDERLMVFVRDELPVTFVTGIMLESPGNILITLPVILASVAIALWRGRLLFAIAFLSAYPFARLLILQGWWMWDRERPKLIADGIASMSSHSFPSGHILLALFVWGMLASRWAAATGNRAEKALAWLLPLAVALGVGYSRLVLGAHWPTDTLAGLLIGIVYLALVLGALRYAEDHASGGRRYLGR